MPEPIAALVALLQTDPPTAALTSGRVYGGELPREEVPQMPRAAVVLRPAGGGLLGRAYQAWGDVRVDVDCFGATPKAAWDLHRAVRTAMKAMRREVHDGTLIHWARLSADAVLARDPDTDWPTAPSSWQVLAADEEVIP
ncbi:MAG: DUF3168 domain-containing protein [Miltoncostaeaceae bacterium]